jgi:hypothetical protein
MLEALQALSHFMTCPSPSPPAAQCLTYVCTTLARGKGDWLPPRRLAGACPLFRAVEHLQHHE